MNPHLIYQAYGRLDILRQTLFSIVSLLKIISPESPLRIVVYTDNKKFFSDFFAASKDSAAIDRMIYVEVSAEQIRKWRGAIDFVHRVKVEVLADAAQKFQGPQFYVDGDTYFVVDPTKLFLSLDDNHSLMHVAEYKISEGRDPLAKKIRKFVAQNEVMVASEKVKVLPEHYMYNAGVLGLSEKNKRLLPLILELTDTWFMLYGKHVIEQLAFSYYLQTRTHVRTCEDVIGHYWNQKDEFQISIDEFLNEFDSWDAAKAAYPKQFQWPMPPQLKPKKGLGESIKQLLGIRI
jgi:hypothetical protein